MQVKCACGKLLKVPDSAAGKSVKCPECARVLKIPAASRASGGAPAASVAGKITVVCSCGKRLAAPAVAAGKRVRCPACKAEITVPAAQAAPGSEMDDPAFALDMSGFEPPSPPSGDEAGNEYAVSTPRCPSCKAELEAGAQFCVACGTHLGSGTHVEGVNLDEVQQKRSERKKGPFIIGGVIAAVIAVTVVTLCFVRPNVDFSFFTSLFESDEEPVPSSEPPPPARSGPPKLGATRIERHGDEGYGNILIRAPTRARAKMNTLAGNQAIQAFEADHGRFPESLEELKQDGYELAELQTGLRYEYDKATGTLKVVSEKDEEAAGNP